MNPQQKFHPDPQCHRLSVTLTATVAWCTKCVKCQVPNVSQMEFQNLHWLLKAISCHLQAPSEQDS